MVCELPAAIKAALKVYKECKLTSPMETNRAFPTKIAEEMYRERGSCLEVLAPMLRRAGAKFIGAGSSRNVYQFSEGCVVKVATSKWDGPGHNLKEAEQHRRLPPKLRPYFIPVGDADKDGWWVTQAKAEKMPLSETTGSGKYWQLVESIRKAGGECWDMYPGNTGIYKGKPVVIDYGATVEGCLTKPPRPRPRPPPGQARLTRFGRRRRSQIPGTSSISGPIPV